MRKFTSLLILQLLFTFTLPAVAPAGEVAGRVSVHAKAPVVTVTPTVTETTATTEKAEEKTSTASEMKWDSKIVLGGRFVDTSKDAQKVSHEIVNLKNGGGIESLKINGVDADRQVRMELRGLGNWNADYGLDADYRVRSKFHVRVKRSRSDMNYGSIMDPGVLRDRLTLNASYDRSELKWRPRIVFSFRGMDTRGDILRSQGNLDQYTPKSRIQETFEPSNQDWNLAVFGGQGKFDMALSAGEQRNKFTSVKQYTMDMPQSTVPRFDGIQDIYAAWRYQDNRSRSFGTKFSYAFNEKYKATVQLDWGWIDNNFDIVRHQTNGATIRSSYMSGLQGQSQGWLDGFTRTERYTLEGSPTEKWDFVTSLERRRSRLRADGALVSYNAANVANAQDLSATQNQLDEGNWNFRADYKGWKNSRAYVGFRILEREEFDNDQLATHAILGGVSTPVATTRARVQFLNREMHERMGFIGFWHRFNPKLDLDVWHEAGTYDDKNSGVVTGVNQRTLVQDYDRSRTGMTARYKATRDLNYYLRASREISDRKDINTEDAKRNVSFNANWAPTGRKFTLGAGYYRTDSDVTLLGQRYRDEIETLSFNSSYRFDDRLTAFLDFNRTETDDVTKLKYNVTDLRFRYDLKKDREITLGVSDQRYKNGFNGGENFDNRVYLFTYGFKR